MLFVLNSRSLSAIPIIPCAVVIRNMAQMKNTVRQRTINLTFKQTWKFHKMEFSIYPPVYFKCMLDKDVRRGTSMPTMHPFSKFWFCFYEWKGLLYFWHLRDGYDGFLFQKKPQNKLEMKTSARLVFFEITHLVQIDQILSIICGDLYIITISGTDLFTGIFNILFCISLSYLEMNYLSET